MLGTHNRLKRKALPSLHQKAHNTRHNYVYIPPTFLAAAEAYTVGLALSFSITSDSLSAAMQQGAQLSANCNK